MKLITLLGLIVWLTSCAAGDRSLLARTALPIEFTPDSQPIRSTKLPLTLIVTVTPISAGAVTYPIETATPIKRVPTPALTSTLRECPPLPEPEGVQTQAAVQHFEHGLMFWLQAKNEIWVLIASPTADQFYWRSLPNVWSDSQPESDPAAPPPAGSYQPVRGFGFAWRSGGGSSGPQRADLGWAIDKEVGFETTLTYYPQGFYSPDCVWMPKSGIYELIDERGNVYQFVGAGGIAKRLTP